MDEEVITIQNLRNLLSIQTSLRDQAERKYESAIHALLSLLEKFAHDEVDSRLKAGQPINGLPASKIEQLLKDKIDLLIKQASNPAGQPVHHNEMQALHKEIQNSRSELERVNAENARLTALITELQDKASGLESQVAAYTQVIQSRQPAQTDHPAGAPAQEQPPIEVEPLWMMQWRNSETFSRDMQVITLLGDTGLSRRPIIEDRVADLLGIQKPGGSIQSMFTRLSTLKLIEIYRPWEDERPGAGGRFPDLVKLSEQGVLAYWLLTRKQAAKNEFDVLKRRHVSAEHTLLNIQAAEIFREAGYQVNIEPPEIRLPGGGVFIPDLIICDHGGIPIYVEVERDTNKDRETRKAKWINAHQAGGGKIYIFCDNRTCMNNLASEINFTFGSRPFSSYLTNLAELQAGKRGYGDSIWLTERQKGQ